MKRINGASVLGLLLVACSTDVDPVDTVALEGKGRPGDACGEGGAKKCKKDLFCLQSDVGSCPDDDGFAGVCSEAPDFCIAVFDPVCGCDGNSYGNACEAYREGVNIAHFGACTGGPCESNDHCASSDYCQASTCDASGTCQPRPEVCPFVYDPVCGCDGITYSNDCFAASAGVNVAHEGECAPPPPPPPSCECGPTEYCSAPAGTCADFVCAPRPEFCTAVYDPVCGCDGMTYSNACVAAMNGQSVAHEGECAP